MATSSNDNLKAAAAYLVGFITGAIILLTEKKSKYVRFHAMQSILWSILFMVLGFIPVLGIFASLLSIVLWIVLMWKAFNGEMYKLPYLGDFAEEQLKKI